MNSTVKIPVAVVLGVSLLLSLFQPVSAQPERSKQRLRVTADLMSVYPDKNYSDFVGHVHAVYNGRILTCRKLRVYFSTESKELDRIEAQDGVRLQDKDLDITCGRLVYYKAEDKVMLTGEPRIRSEESEFRGEVMTMFLESRRLVIEGGVDADILLEGKAGR